MNRSLAEFVDMLRYADVPVSIGEVLDAGRTIELLGYDDRGLLKAALSQVMAKTTEEMESFDQCFEEFFSSGISIDLDEKTSNDNVDNSSDDENENQGEDNSSDTLSTLDEMDPPSQPSASGDGGGGGSGQQSGENPSGEGSDPQSLLNMLEQGDRTELTLAMTAAAERSNLSNIVLMTQRGLFSRRIMEEMGLAEVNQEISNRRREEDEEGAEDLVRRLDILFEAVRDMVERQLALTSDGKNNQFRQDDLL